MSTPISSDRPSIRPATSADVAAIAAIYNETILLRDATMVLEPVDAADVRTWLGKLDPRESLWVLTESDRIQGWGIVKFYSDRPGYARACETSVFIRRSEIGRGLGSHLQEKLLDAAREADFHHVVVRIWAANESSIAMHRKFGFTVLGTQKEVGFVDDRWVDVTIMQCVLDA
ncbi:MAG: GNAT family N-acetyltransferase [Bacteroidota bacterium]|nr:GNAT family N-acetyltransferase [Bacteroidota bacterium]